MSRTELWWGGALVLLAGCNGAAGDNVADGGLANATADNVLQMMPEPAHNAAMDNATTANVAVPANVNEPPRDGQKTSPESRRQSKPASTPDKKPEPMAHPPGHEMNNME